MKPVFLACLAVLLVGCGQAAAPVVVPTAPATAVPTVALAKPTAAPAQWPDRPEQLVVTLSDLPPGFTMDPKRTGPRSNEERVLTSNNAAVVAANFAKWQRIDGYDAYYQRSGLESLVGTGLFGCELVLFQTGDGAVASFTSYQEGVAANPKWARVSVRKIGDEVTSFRTTWTTEEGGSKWEWAAYELGFRKGNLFGWVSTTGTAATLGFDDVQKYAELMASRLK